MTGLCAGAAGRIALLAFEMEKAGKAGDLGSVRARMGDLEREFVRLKEAWPGLVLPATYQPVCDTPDGHEDCLSRQVLRIGLCR